MPTPLRSTLRRLFSNLVELCLDLFPLGNAVIRSRSVLVAENLFLRKQLAFYREHRVKPRRLTDAARLSLLLWSRLFNWTEALVIVKPGTLIGWHREGFRWFWRLRSRPGRRRLPKNIRELIARMVRENPTWGQARIAAELCLELAIRVSPRTVRKYWLGEPDCPKKRRAPSQHWKTFVRNHAEAIVACDFMIAVTARSQLLYGLVIMEVGSRRILHCNLTAHPTAEWTLQQFREGIANDHAYRFLIHDRDSIFSVELDRELDSGFGVKALRTPPQSPQANAYCERLIGTVRRECLDFVIPLSEKHLRRTLHEWVSHYNRGRPHASLGPGIPDRRHALLVPRSNRRHTLSTDAKVASRPILGGLHHEYRLERIAA